MSSYKVIDVSESGISVIFLGSASVPIQRVEMEINKLAAQGWKLVFQVVEAKRFLLFWKVDRMIMTFHREAADVRTPRS
jgi:hypothetical protein